MKKIILVASMVFVALNVSACGDSQAEKDKKEHEASVLRSTPVPMPKIDLGTPTPPPNQQKNTAPAPEIKLGEPNVK